MSSCSDNTFKAVSLGVVSGLLSPFGINQLFGEDLINPITSNLSEVQTQYDTTRKEWISKVETCKNKEFKNIINLMVQCMDCGHQDVENSIQSLSFNVTINRLLIIGLIFAVIILFIYDLFIPIK